MKSDLVVVGSGFFGLTIAREAAERLGIRVLILEKRDHVGGNAFSYMDQDTGIEVHKYGSHLFHTSNERIWQYVNRFTKFNDYVHRVFTVHKGNTYSIPINLHTIRQFYGNNCTPTEARDLINNARSEFSSSEIGSLEQKAISLIGRPLYEALIRGYTQKQWESDPRELPEEIITRLPVRYNFDSRYFSDKYQGLPLEGYSRWIERLVDHPRIEVMLGKDFFAQKNSFVGNVPIVYTGAIDEYYDYCAGRLNWRTLDFHTEKLEIEDFQGNSVINFADTDVAFTRIHEFKHLHPERELKGVGTIIAREFSRSATKLDEPYYPVNLKDDREKLSEYKKMVEGESGVWFGGRLGSYRYLDMHMAIGAALTMFDREIFPFFKRP